MVNRHTKWIEANFPEFAHLGQREVDRTIERADRWLGSVMIFLHVGAVFLGVQSARYIFDLSFSEMPLSSKYPLIVALCSLPYSFVATKIYDGVVRWRIKAVIRDA